MSVRITEICGRIAAGIVTAFCCAAMAGCMKYGPLPQESFSYPMPDDGTAEGVFIICEGNFMYGNASMSFYLPSTGELQNEIFARANGMKLGDVAQSMTMYDGTGYVVVNNSGVIFGMDPETFVVKRVIRGMGSPRYILFHGDKAYVTSLYEPEITVLDAHTMQPVGKIPTPGHTSTEQMAVFGDLMYVTCWSYDNTVLKIDTRKDEIVGNIEVRNQPRQLTIDSRGKLWVLTDGGSAEGGTTDTPALYRIDASNGTVEKEFVFRRGDSPKGLCCDGARETIYFLNGDLWRMDCDAENLPDEPFLESSGTIYYAIGVDPHNGDVYVGDAVDYQQQGVVYRLNDSGRCLDTLRVGITPTAFCFR